MTKRIVILSFLMASLCLGMNATNKKRIQCTFDQGWTFKLCANHAEATKVLNTLGIENPNISASSSVAKKTKVTDDTEPEQAQVTASEITTSHSAQIYADKDFRKVTIPHDWSIELPFDPKVGGSAGYLQGGQGVYAKDFVIPAEYRKMLIGKVSRKMPLECGTVAHIRLTLVDKGGRIQQMQPKKFRVEVEGPVRLLGVETGDMRRKDSWRTTELPTYFGEGLVRLQSTMQTGKAKVIFHVEGFDKPFVKEVEVKE